MKPEKYDQVKICWLNRETNQGGSGQWHSKSEEPALTLLLKRVQNRWPELDHWLEYRDNDNPEPKM